MSSVKNKLYSKIGISESSLKTEGLFSPKANNLSSKFMDGNTAKAEKAIKILSTTTISSNKNTQGCTPYQNFRLEMLVPAMNPPKSTLESCKSTKNKLTYEYHNDSSPIKSRINKITKDFSLSSSGKYKANNVSNLENLNNNIKLNKPENVSSVVKAYYNQDKNQTAKLNNKKEGLIEMLWDNKGKTNLTLGSKNKLAPNSFCGKNNPVGTKREISLLSSRLNKLFNAKK